MSITAEYRRITRAQFEWFLKKPYALYDLLFPESFEATAKASTPRRVKSIGSALADFKAYVDAMQNPGTNDELIVAKLPSMMQQWRKMVGEEGAQRTLKTLADNHPGVAEYLSRNSEAAEPSDDGLVLNIENAWDGVHFVLTGAREPGAGPISRAVFGDREIPDKSGVMGYGPARVLSVEQVAECAVSLKQAEPRLSERFDAAALVEAEVYAMHDDPDGLSYLSFHYGRLCKFYEEAARESQAMAVYMA